MQDIKRILWIGTVADKEHLKFMNSLGGRDSTACNVQCKLIDGLEQCGICVDVISGHVMKPFPKYKKLMIPRRIWSRNNNSYNVDVAIINIPIVNRISKTINLRKEVLKRCKNTVESSIYVYALHTPFLLAAIKAKKKNSKIKVYSIVPDLPEFMDTNMSRLKKAAKKLDRYIINYLLEFVDGFVLFSENMKKQLPISNKPYVIMEGIIDIDPNKYFNILEQRKSSYFKKTIMLSGTLAVSEGIEQLLLAFHSIKDADYKLWITGNGNEEAITLIKKYAKDDSRITFWGYITDYDKFLKLQNKASVFVSAVPPGNPKAQYFFPSKLMEYLVTGAPVISYKLPCIPNEYDEFLCYVLEDNPSALAQKLTEVCNTGWDEIEKMSIKRLEFLLHKDTLHQAQKLLSVNQ